MKRFAIVTVVVASAWGGAPTAGAASPEPHCVVHVVGQRSTGEMILGPPACYSKFDEAMRSENVGTWGEGAAAKAGDASLATFTIGTHYEFANYGGASTSVVGSDCNGGWLNTSSAWNNRISSTRHGCARIRHYNGANLTGSSQTTTAPGGNLTSLDNLTSSIQYLS